MKCIRCKSENVEEFKTTSNGIANRVTCGLGVGACFVAACLAPSFGLKGGAIMIGKKLADRFERGKELTKYRCKRCGYEWTE